MKEKDRTELLKQCKDIGFNFTTENEPTLKKVNELMHDRLDPSNVVELWFDYGTLSDYGETVEDYLSINDELYEFTLKLEVEWVGDWSVRSNVATEFEIVSFNKV